MSTFALIPAAVLTFASLFSATESHPQSAEQASAVRSTAADNSGRGCVRAHGTDSWTLKLAGGVPAMITVEGDGDTDLDAYLYDENGNLIDFDDDITDFCILEVTPRWTGEFELVIKNLGAVANIYEVEIL